MSALSMGEQSPRWSHGCTGYGGTYPMNRSLSQRERKKRLWVLKYCHRPTRAARRRQVYKRRSMAMSGTTGATASGHGTGFVYPRRPCGHSARPLSPYHGTVKPSIAADQGSEGAGSVHLGNALRALETVVRLTSAVVWYALDAAYPQVSPIDVDALSDDDNEDRHHFGILDDMPDAWSAEPADSFDEPIEWDYYDDGAYADLGNA